jgi:uncharacterized protein (DUF2235 family)
LSRNIIVLCDGTGNQIERNLSNVLKLFRVAVKNDAQRVHYNPGIGTIGSSDAWARMRSDIKSVFELATGYGLDDDILSAYNFICENYSSDDSIFLFGFSRGAYTVRVVAGMIHMLGLLSRDHIANYALRAYKQASENNDFRIAWQFRRVAACREARIKFLGLWDTVSSIFVPRPDRILPQQQFLPYTKKNPCVAIVRHAVAIDERRAMFRLNRWEEPQPFVERPFDKSAPKVKQDVKQVWFAGVHSDIGGGYPEEDSGLAKFPLSWMIDQAVLQGLLINTAMRNHIVLGRPSLGSKRTFVRPDAAGCMHDSLSWGWRRLEWVPKPEAWREWPRRSTFIRLYLPRGEPRLIDTGGEQPLIHQSVLDRMKGTNYAPINFPITYRVEP